METTTNDTTKYLNDYGQFFDKKDLLHKKNLLPKLSHVKQQLKEIRSSPLYFATGEVEIEDKYPRELEELKRSLQQGLEFFFTDYSFKYFKSLKADQIDYFIKRLKGCLILSKNFFDSTELFIIENTQTVKEIYNNLMDDITAYFEHIFLRYRLILLQYPKNEIFDHCGEYFIKHKFSKKLSKKDLIQNFLCLLAFHESSQFQIV